MSLVYKPDPNRFDLRSRFNNKDLYQSIGVVLFLLYFGFAGIKSYLSSEVYWFIGILPLLSSVPLILFFAGQTFASPYPSDYQSLHWYLVYWAIFCAAIVLSAAFNNWLGLYTIIKYSVIGMISIYLIICPPPPSTLRYGLQLWCAISLLLIIIFIIFNMKPPLMIAGGVRYGWHLAPPGVLWKSGIFLVPWLIWKLLNQPRWYYWVWLLFACTIVRLDGSRTGLFAIILILMLLTLVAILRRRKPIVSIFLQACNISLINLLSFSFYFLFRKSYMEFFYASLIIFISAAMIWVIQHCWHKIMVRRFIAFFLPSTIVIFLAISYSCFNVPNIQDLYEKGGVRTLEDSIRPEMIKEGFQAALNNFPLGGGFGSTMVETDNTSHPRMVVHMTYLQVLSDLGPLGLIGYLGILGLPIWNCIKNIRQSSQPWDSFDIAVLPLSILFVYLFSGLFHPISNELSEWAIVIVAISMLINFQSNSDSLVQSTKKPRPTT